MTTRHLMTLALLALTATVARGQTTTRVAVSPESKLWIDGTSNLHDWSCKTTALEADVELDATAATQLTTAVPKALKKVEVRIPVKSLHCNHGGMDGNLYKALKANDTPEISYIMATFEATPAEVKDTFMLKTVGTLTIAGKQNRIEMDVSATRLADGSVIAKGTVPVKMTDYGIMPPTAIFGRLKTGDEVKVSFELTIGASAISSAIRER